jgi:hypothetical protein
MNYISDVTRLHACDLQFASVVALSPFASVQGTNGTLKWRI